METTLSKSIRTTDKKAEYDAACKELLSEKIILAWILKDCVDEFRDIDVREISEYCIEDTPQISKIPVDPDEEEAGKIRGENTEDKTVYEGTVRYDIRFHAFAPGSDERIRLIINVEAQNDFYPGYPLLKRGIYYCSRMISSQYGREFTDSYYEKIKKVYSIWICMNPPENRCSTITRYRISEENLVGSVKECSRNYDLMSVIMVCLGKTKTNQENYRGVLKLLDVLLSNKAGQEEKRRVLETDFDIPMSIELEGRVNAMCNLSDGVFREGVEKGIEKGMEKGLKRGAEKGAEKKQVENIGNLMDSMKLSVEQAMAALKIPEADWGKYRELVKEAG